MKYFLTVFLGFAVLPVFSQIKKNMLRTGYTDKEKYISLNFLSVVEPVFAFGPSFGCRFTERSEYFIEVAYTAKSPFYDWQNINRLQGARLLLQYRYHFLGEGKPLINFGLSRLGRRENQQSFIAAEFRFKPSSFSSKGNFINPSLQDTLINAPFSARTNAVGGALLFGRIINLSASEKWKLEITAGFGASHRFVKLKTIPAGYRVYGELKKSGPGLPLLQEETGSAYFPMAFRLRYTIN